MIKTAEFVTSVGSLDKLLDNPVEIAVAGKSNVGKSSFINFICNYGKLAKTSSEPGRTRLINYFSINKGEFFMVDLPGYGYARVSNEEKKKWGNLIEGYLMKSKGLKNVLLLVDIRHDPSEDDLLMINYLHHYAIPFTIIATKADKLSRFQCMNRRQEIANRLQIGTGNVFVVSSEKKTGKEEIFERLKQIILT